MSATIDTTSNIYCYIAISCDGLIESYCLKNDESAEAWIEYMECLGHSVIDGKSNEVSALLYSNANKYIFIA